MKKRFIGACALLMALPMLALGVEFDFDSGLNISLDTSLTYGAQWRTENRDKGLTSEGLLAALQEDPFLPLTDRHYIEEQTLVLNGDDGNNNFDTGMISNRLTVLMEMDANWESYGLFMRGRAYYDAVYRNQTTDMDELGYRSYNSGELYGGDAAIGEFPSETRDDHGTLVEFLDVFAYATWDLPGDRLLDLRVGRQVINWGESTFYQGINAIQNRADARAANTPGVEVKEILLPTGAIYTQFDLLPTLTMEAYYQYEWLENELNGVGSYFSTNDQVGPGANAFLIPTPGLPIVPENVRGNEYHIRAIPRMADEDASDSGQWGVGFHYVTESNWDIGLFHVVGHDKKPSLVLDYIDVPGSPEPVPNTYRLKYFEDIKGTAISATGILGQTNIQGELSLLQDTPMVNAAGDPELQDLWKIQIGGSHVFGPTFFADDVVLTFEAFHAAIDGVKSREVREDSYANGYSLYGTLAYKNVISGWDVSVPVYFKHDVSGVINELQAFGGSKVLSLGVEGTYLNNLIASVAYSIYFGGEADNLLYDRDNIAITLKYSF